MGLTVACVWVKGHVPFTADYVVKLRSMVARNLDMPHRFVCLTDRPSALPEDIETLPAACPVGLKAWWTKLRMFDGCLSGRVLYLDLDTLVVGRLEPIVTYPSTFALIPHAGSFAPTTHRIVPLYNSSVMVFEPAAYPDVWRHWNPGVARKLFGDQDWLGELLPDLDQMPLEWFPRLSELKHRKPKRSARVVLTKKPKTHIAATMYPWVREAWG